MTQGWTGERGNGKSFLLMKTMMSRLPVNRDLHERFGLPIRKTKVMRTLGLAPWFSSFWKNYIDFFDDFEDLPSFQACDVYCDDITLRLSARAWDMFPLEVQDWLTASERLSNHFYFTAVTFKRVVIDFRETTDYLSVVTKGWGSKRPMIGYPPVKHIYGFIHECPVVPAEFRADSFDEGKAVKEEGGYRSSVSMKLGAAFVPLGTVPVNLTYRTGVAVVTSKGVPNVNFCSPLHVMFVLLLVARSVSLSL